jgi:hypothetical protein
MRFQRARSRLGVGFGLGLLELGLAQDALVAQLGQAGKLIRTAVSTGAGDAVHVLAHRGVVGAGRRGPALMHLAAARDEVDEHTKVRHHKKNQSMDQNT